MKWVLAIGLAAPSHPLLLMLDGEDGEKTRALIQNKVPLTSLVLIPSMICSWSSILSSPTTNSLSLTTLQQHPSNPSLHLCTIYFSVCYINLSDDYRV